MNHQVICAFDELTDSDVDDAVFMVDFLYECLIHARDFYVADFFGCLDSELL